MISTAASSTAAQRSTAAGAALIEDVARQLLGLRRIMRQFHRHALARATDGADDQLGEGQYFVLFALGEEEQLTAGDLADRCHVADPTISKALNQLEAQGLVARRMDLSNRRVVQVTLTPTGRARLQRAEARWLGSLTQILSTLDSTQLQDLAVAFGHLEGLADRTAREEVAHGPAQGVK